MVFLEQKDLIKAFLQGAVYSWVKNMKGEQFAANDLVGGENFEWQGAPLYVLYENLSIELFETMACRTQMTTFIAVREVLFNGREAFGWHFKLL